MNQRLASSQKHEASAGDQPRVHKRPELRLIQDRRPGRFSRFTALKRLTPRGRVVALLTAVVIALFGVVVFHVNISQSQFALEEMRSKANEEQDRYERLRMEVSTLESPRRISNYARDNLGLVVPDQVKALAPQQSDVAKGVPIGGISKGQNPQVFEEGDLGWAALKPHFSASSS